MTSVADERRALDRDYRDALRSSRITLTIRILGNDRPDFLIINHAKQPH